MAQTITDLRMQLTDQGYYDLVISNGTFETISGFESAILMSLLPERRADSSEISQPQKRRGWIGNEMNDLVNSEIGSKLWLLAQARLTQDSVNKAVDFARLGLQWFIDDGYTERIDVTGQIKNNSIILTIIFINENDIITKIGFDIWRQTIINE
jgi:phage gp46-like protein